MPLSVPAAVRGAVCALALRPEMSRSPSLCPRKTQLWQKRPVRVLGALSAAPAAEEDASGCPITHGSRAKQVHGAPRGIWQRKASCAASVATGCLLLPSFSQVFFPLSQYAFGQREGRARAVHLCLAGAAGQDEMGVRQMLQPQRCRLWTPCSPALAAASPLSIFSVRCRRGEAPRSCLLLHGASGK